MKVLNKSYGRANAKFKFRTINFLKIKWGERNWICFQLIGSDFDYSLSFLSFRTRHIRATRGTCIQPWLAPLKFGSHRPIRPTGVLCWALSTVATDCPPILDQMYSAFTNRSGARSIRNNEKIGKVSRSYNRHEINRRCVLLMAFTELKGVEIFKRRTGIDSISSSVKMPHKRMENIFFFPSISPQTLGPK